MTAARNIVSRDPRILVGILVAALAATALIVDAAFVDLEPGATATSLLRTLATLALLGTIAAAFGPLPRGVNPFARELGARLRRRRRRPAPRLTPRFA
jgi:hypothetical protein